MNTKIAYEFLLVDTCSSDNGSSLVDYEIIRVNLLSIKIKHECNGVTIVFYFKNVISGTNYRIDIFVNSSKCKDTFNHVNWLRYLHKKLFDMYSISEGDLKDLVNRSIKYMEEAK